MKKLTNREFAQKNGGGFGGNAEKNCIFKKTLYFFKNEFYTMPMVIISTEKNGLRTLRLVDDKV